MWKGVFDLLLRTKTKDFSNAVCTGGGRLINENSNNQNTVVAAWHSLNISKMCM